MRIAPFILSGTRAVNHGAGTPGADCDGSRSQLRYVVHGPRLLQSASAHVEPATRSLGMSSIAEPILQPGTNICCAPIILSPPGQPDFALLQQHRTYVERVSNYSLPQTTQLQPGRRNAMIAEPGRRAPT